MGAEQSCDSTGKDGFPEEVSFKLSLKDEWGLAAQEWQWEWSEMSRTTHRHRIRKYGAGVRETWGVVGFTTLFPTAPNAVPDTQTKPVVLNFD